MSENVLTLNPEFGLQEGIRFSSLITSRPEGLELRRAKWTHGLRTYRLKTE